MGTSRRHPQICAVVRVCRERDLALLEASIPSPGRSQFHHRRFAEQASGSGTYLIAWVEQRPVGHVLVRWSGADEADVRRAIGLVPMLSALGVTAARRGRGIGTALIGHAETIARARGHATLGLGVNVENAAARRLYERLGYRDWGHGTVLSHWTWTDGDGTPIREEERLHILLKPLASRGTKRSGPSRE